MNFDSKEWAEVCEQIDQAVEAMKEQLCSQSPETSTAFLRGGIASLRALRRWPQSLIEEAQDAVQRSNEQHTDFGV